ncbi:MAG: ABC transporter ATP-binding protein [Pseudomonadota bacterium]
MSDQPFVKIMDAKKEFAQGRAAITVFEALDLTVPKGAFIALMGPSGSGKTTLLHAIGGLERLTSGTLRVGERQIERDSESQLSRWRAQTVGFVFQFYNLMPMLNAAGNIGLPLLLTKLGGGERRQRVEAAADLVGMSHRLRHRPRELSGGEQQRVAIARAIVSDPPLLLCDEPTGDLDRATSTEVLTILRTLCDELGKTIVMVTHDPSAAEYADRVFHLDKGQLVPTGEMT